MGNQLRILVVLPMYGGSLPVGRFCAKALSESGHLVEAFEAPDFYQSYKALEKLKVTTDRLEYLQNSYLQVTSQAVLAKVETFEPDLVLALAQAPLSHKALKRLRRENVTTAMWFVEDFRLFTYWQSFAPFYDFFAVIQKEPFTEKLHEAGQDNVLYLPLAADPDFHKPIELNPVDSRKFGADVSFMGAGYPNRRMAFRELARKGFKLWGNEWDGDELLEKYQQMGGARVSSEDCVKIFNGTKVNLNLHSSIQAEELVTRDDFINPRTFEIASCEAFQLVDQRLLLPESFEADEMATYSSIKELKEKIEYFLDHPDERQDYAKKGRARVLKDHSYAARMNTLLDFIAEKKPGWPNQRQSESLYDKDFPPELAREISNLVSRLGLPADVDFKDLVWAVRNQNGKLSDLDASILFLDEWKKLYSKKR